MTNHRTNTYLPQRDYPARNYKPFGCGYSDLCGECKFYYKKLHRDGLVETPAVPKCDGHVTDPIKDLREEDFDSADQYLDARILLDPISWAVKELGWDSRWYQNEFLSCTARFKVSRQGRRSGKTEGACVGMLHKAITNSHYKILILAPYEAQIQLIFDIIRKLIAGSMSLGSSIFRSTMNPHRIELNNGSVILGMSAGSKTAAGSDKIRGQDANLIYIDEFDYIPDEDINAVVAILASHPDCEMWATSTPTGEHKKFFAYCTDKRYGYKEFWVIGQESPSWNAETEKMLRAQYGAISGTSPAWEHEVLAEFGEQEAGIFKNSALDASLQDYSLFDSVPQGGEYILGVDWNKTRGTHMVIVEKLTLLETGIDGDSKDAFKLIKKVIIPRSEFGQTEAVQDIINLNNAWNFKDIFVDAGYGETQVEMLKRFGLRNPRTGLHKKVKAFEMQRQIEVRDPSTGITRMTPIKPFLVNTLANALDLGCVILPYEEDTNVIRDNEDQGVVQQMRNFRMEGTSVHGLPKYSQGQDHTLTALMLVVGGYELKYGLISRVHHNGQIGFAASIGADGVIPEQQQDIHSEIIKNLQESEKRSLNNQIQVGHVKVKGHSFRRLPQNSPSRRPSRNMPGYTREDPNAHSPFTRRPDGGERGMF